MSTLASGWEETRDPVTGDITVHITLREVDAMRMSTRQWALLGEAGRLIMEAFSPEDEEDR